MKTLTALRPARRGGCVALATALLGAVLATTATAQEPELKIGIIATTKPAENAAAKGDKTDKAGDSAKPAEKDKE